MFSQHLDKKCFQTASIVLFCLISSTSSLIVKHKKLTKLHVDKTLDINSLDLPQNLSGYHLSAPHNHKITVNCSYVSADNASSGEYLLVQTDVTHNGDGGQSIFLSSNFTKTSLFNHLIIVLRQNGTSTSSELSDDAARGHFACHVQVETAKRCVCGWGRQAHRRIVNGNETEVNEFPSAVALIHIPSNYTFCGGTIIHHRYIMSAGHCFVASTYRNRYVVKIVLGGHNYYDTSSSSYHSEYQFDKILTHPEYETDEQDNDISLLHITRDIIYTRGVGPACLPWKYREETFFDKEVEMVGWGTISYGGHLSHVLRKVAVTVMDTDVCDKKIIWVNEKKLCTYAPKRDACQSDSGGPVYYTSENGQQYVVGIISFGIKCATEAPGVNTRVTDYLDWIEEEINDEEGFCDI